jgi:hypothetical protein
VEEILKVYESNHLDPPWSHVLVLSLDLVALVCLAWCIRELLSARQAANQAREVEESALALSEGARFIAGHVELAKDADIAVRITLTQEGRQTKHRYGFRHTWTETNRETEVQPFYLRTESGERVRVEPPRDVVLVDKLDQMDWNRSDFRRRRAEVTPGEWAIVEGRLTKGIDPENPTSSSSYRTTGPTDWTMTSVQRGGMHISTESLSTRYHLRARAFLRTTLGLVALGLISFCFTIPYRTRAYLGHNVIGIYERKQYVPGSKRRGQPTLSKYLVTVSASENSQPFVAQYQVRRDDYERLPKEKGRIWIRYVPGKPSVTTLGSGASFEGYLGLISAFFLSVGVEYLMRTRRYRRWYEGKYVETALGTLPIPPNTKFDSDNVVEGPPLPRKPAEPREPIEVDVDVESKEIIRETRR